MCRKRLLQGDTGNVASDTGEPDITRELQEEDPVIQCFKINIADYGFSVR